VQKKVDILAKHMNVPVLETLMQYSKIPQICTLFKRRTDIESFRGQVTRNMPPQQRRSSLENMG
jgi:hypothetical protein